MACGRQGRGGPELSEQGVLWGPGNLGKEAECKTRGAKGRRDKQGWAWCPHPAENSSGMRWPVMMQRWFVLLWAFFFLKKIITSLEAKIVMFN